MTKAITTTLAPNYQVDDAALSLRLLISPWRWRHGPAAAQLEEEFARWLPIRHAVSFGSGRAALKAVLQAVGLQPGDEVLVQAFTCVAVPGAVQWAGLKPVYVDIDPQTYTMDVAGLERRLTPRSRAVIVQHTFGLAADLGRICAIARQHRLLIIEDCAHALGPGYHGKRLGRFGDAAIFSFGRDKVISSVFGGLAVTDRDAVALKLRQIQRRCRRPSRRWIAQQLLHPPLTLAARRTLHLAGLGKVILKLGRIFRLLSLAVESGERRGEQPSVAEFILPNALAVLAYHQLGKLERFNAHRREIAARYRQLLGPMAVHPPPDDAGRGNGYLLYTIRVADAARLLATLAEQGIHLGEWYRTAIAPHDVQPETVGYAVGSCPRAEAAAAAVVNLPTHIGISQRDASRLAAALQPVAPPAPHLTD